jgi:hypothetical protein
VAHEVARRRIGAGRQLDAALGPEGRARDVGQQAVDARHGSHPGHRAPLLARRRAVQRVGHEHEPLRRDGAQLLRAQQDLRAELVAADQRARPRGLHAEGGMTSASQSSVYGWRGRSSESPCSGRSGRIRR